MKRLQRPSGTRDILPEEQKYWNFLNNAITKRALAFGFEKIDTPIFESKSVFSRAVGETTDIVEKEMYELKRSGDVNSEKISTNPEENRESLVLRPEGTAGVVRSYMENGMQIWPQPVKLFYIGPMFRYDRPQRGRFRQFTQAGIEILGDESPLTDSISILLLWQILSDLGLREDTIMEINSIGCKSCRNKFRKKLLEYYKPYLSMLCTDCNRRFLSNPLRLLDCKEEKCQKISTGAPQIIDNLCVDCKSHFTKVLEYLDDLDITYDLNPHLVRGLDYYSRTTFEIHDKNDTSRQSSLGGGGRYDNLVELMGGKPTPAIGWALGYERIIEKIKEKNIEIEEPAGAELFIIQIGEKARKLALPLVADLNKKGYNASCVLGKESLKSQLRAAGKMKAKFAIIIGQREALDGTMIIRDMQEAAQETIAQDKLDKYLEKRFKK